MTKKKPTSKYAQIHYSEWYTTYTPIVIDYGCETLALYFYLLSNPARNMTGIYKFNFKYAAADLDLDMSTLEGCFGDLLESGLIEYDTETREIFVKDMLRTQADYVRSDSSDNRVKNVDDWLSNVESERLYQSFLTHNEWM